MSSPTSATDSRHEHPTDPSTPAAHDTGLAAHAETSGRGSLDGDPEASALPQAAISRSRLSKPKLRQTMFAKCRAPFGPGGYCDRQPSGRHPPTAAFSATGRICDVTSDTLCRAPRAIVPRPKPRSAAAACQTRSHRRLVKDSGFARARAPSTDECLAAPLSRPNETRHRARDFAVVGRLPALLRLPCLIPKEGRLDPKGPGAARRLLQSIGTASTSSVIARTRALHARPKPGRMPGGVAPCGALPAEVSRVRGAVWLSPTFAPLSPRLLAARAFPQPDWLGHLMS